MRRQKMHGQYNTVCYYVYLISLMEDVRIKNDNQKDLKSENKPNISQDPERLFHWYTSEEAELYEKPRYSSQELQKRKAIFPFRQRHEVNVNLRLLAATIEIAEEEKS